MGIKENLFGKIFLATPQTNTNKITTTTLTRTTTSTVTRNQRKKKIFSKNIKNSKQSNQSKYQPTPLHSSASPSHNHTSFHTYTLTFAQNFYEAFFTLFLFFLTRESVSVSLLMLECLNVHFTIKHDCFKTLNLSQSPTIHTYIYPYIYTLTVLCTLLNSVPCE